MPAYKTQHFLPSAYLKYFSVDQQNCDRKSFVRRLDDKTLRSVPVVSQCSANYFYSKEKAAETEKMFQVNEDAYCKCVDKIRIRQEPEGRNLGDLLLAMFDFYLRNVVRNNRTGKERIEAYSRCVDIFITQILLGRSDSQITKADVTNHLLKYWRVKIISTSSNHQFLASDHPSIWRTLGEVSIGLKTKLHLMTLPLTPEFLAIGFDRRVLEIVGDQANSKDIGILNTAQIENSNQCIYMSKLLPNEQIETIKSYLANKPVSLCEVNEEGWKIAWYPLLPEKYFSFMRLKPLLF
jgi:hypothetical protein